MANFLNPNNVLNTLIYHFVTPWNLMEIYKYVVHAGGGLPGLYDILGYYNPIEQPDEGLEDASVKSVILH